MRLAFKKNYLDISTLVEAYSKVDQKNSWLYAYLNNNSNNKKRTEMKIKYRLVSFSCMKSIDRKPENNQIVQIVVHFSRTL